MLVGFPLIQNVVSLHRGTDGVQHIAVALGMNALLKGLYGQAEIDLVGRHILADVGQIGRLYGIEENQKTEDLVIRRALRREQLRVILHILRQIDFLRNPEIVHRLPVPVADPRVLHIVEIVEIGGIAADHTAQAHVNITVRIEKRLFSHLFHLSPPYDEQLSQSSTSSDLLRT